MLSDKNNIAMNYVIKNNTW